MEGAQGHVGVFQISRTRSIKLRPSINLNEMGPMSIMKPNPNKGASNPLWKVETKTNMD